MPTIKTANSRTKTANMATKMATTNRQSPPGIAEGSQDGQPLYYPWVPSPVRQCAGGRTTLPPGSKNVANWQTQLFFGRSLHCRMPLRQQLSLPTVANSVANWQTHFGSLPFPRILGNGEITTALR